jgi:hypothetical protein
MVKKLPRRAERARSTHAFARAVFNAFFAFLLFFVVTIDEIPASGLKTPGGGDGEQQQACPAS